MTAVPAGALLADTGFWYGFLDPKDQHHKSAQSQAYYLEKFQIIVPWPTLYETVGTRLVKKRDQIQAFDRILKRRNIVFLEDENYRDNALELALESAILGKRPVSLVDMTLRLILADPNVRIRGLLTFNVRDFHDVCRQEKIEILTS